MKIKISEATELYLELVGVKDDSGNLIHKGLLHEKMDFFKKVVFHDLAKSIKDAVDHYTNLDEIDMNEEIEVYCDDIIDDIHTTGFFDQIESEIYCPTLFNVLYP